MSWDIEEICSFIREKEQVHNLVTKVEGKDTKLEYRSQEERVIGSCLTHLCAKSHKRIYLLKSGLKKLTLKVNPQ